MNTLVYNSLSSLTAESSAYRYASDFIAYHNGFVDRSMKYQRMMYTILSASHVHSTKANKKLYRLAQHLGFTRDNVRQFDLPSGITCPSAYQCKLMSHRITGKLTRFESTIWDCYAAKNETQYSNVRALVNMNLCHMKDHSETVETLTKELLNAFPAVTRIMRLHSKGDIYTQQYFDALCNVADMLPQVSIFGYTKVLDYALATKPVNFHLQYSHGGKDDQQSAQYDVPTCYVVKDYEEAQQLGVDVICDTPERDWVDYDYIVNRHESFALLLHN